MRNATSYLITGLRGILRIKKIEATKAQNLKETRSLSAIQAHFFVKLWDLLSLWPRKSVTGRKAANPYCKRISEKCCLVPDHSALSYKQIISPGSVRLLRFSLLHVAGIAIYQISRKGSAIHDGCPRNHPAQDARRDSRPCRRKKSAAADPIR